MKIGSMVYLGRACGALAMEGSVDLPNGTVGRLLGVRGHHAKIELPEGKVVFLASEYIKQ